MSSKPEWWKLTQAIAWAYYRSGEAVGYATSSRQLRLLSLNPHQVDNELPRVQIADGSADNRAFKEKGFRKEFVESLCSGKLRAFAVDEFGKRSAIEPLAWKLLETPEKHRHYEQLVVDAEVVRKLWPSDGSAPDRPPVSAAQLENWWEEYRQHNDVDAMSKEKLLLAAEAAFPRHKISRQRVRDLVGCRKRGRKPIRG